MALRRFSTSNISGSKSSKVWDGETFPGYFESIATVVLGSTSTTVDFTNIPQNYTHLQIRATARSAYPGVSTVGSPQLRFNDDSNTNYSNHRFGTFQSGNFADGEGNEAQAGGIAWISAATATTGIFGAFVMDILDYSNTNKYKTVRTIAGVDLNGGGGWAAHTSNGWRSTSAITKISFLEQANYGWIANSQFALYGIRGA
ncbi:MAG: hypothetical protein EB101_05255 [Chitinophagia bacterium]|nr:hypothetical protein [Chitinophagia bacterium]